MLAKNLESEHGGEDRKHAGRLWRETLWAIISSVTFVALFPIGLAAQTARQPRGSGASATTYGSSAPTPLQFQGEAAATNLVTISTGVSTLYDDNVLSRNSERSSDEALSFNVPISAFRERLST